MSVFLLNDECNFPDPRHAEPDGLLAVGGDLSFERLLTAYAHGIFPWYNDNTPILWWSPEPRPIICPSEVHLSRSLRRLLRKKLFTVTMDTVFPRVIRHCAEVGRPQGEGTWLLPEMIEAYENLFDEGLAHSVEVWRNEELVGGLYGVSLGGAFFGESMFHLEPNASKVGLAHLCRTLEKWEFHFIDCQQSTPHILSMGAVEVSREKFQHMLRQAIQVPTRRMRWRAEG
jgi:leucyl/phenylalanyl-tRNA--protein transferase